MRLAAAMPTRVCVFAAWHIEGLDPFITRERQRADEGAALRRCRCGASWEEKTWPLCARVVLERLLLGTMFDVGHV